MNVRLIGYSDNIAFISCQQGEHINFDNLVDIRYKGINF